MSLPGSGKGLKKVLDTRYGKEGNGLHKPLKREEIETGAKRKMDKVIITVLGQDKPGIIAAVSESLHRGDCNIENVSQMILQSEFAGLFIVSLPEGSPMEELSRRLGEDLAPLGLDVHMKRMETPDAGAEKPATEPFIITTVGPDAKGLVAAITRIIADHRVNVANLKAVFEGGDNPNRNVMIYEVDIPVDADRDALCTALRARASELWLDISIQHRNIFDAINKI